MKDKVFIDTNILVYANDKSDNYRHEKSKQLIFDGIQKENAVISTQVLSEFFVTVTQKIKTKLSAGAARKEILLFNYLEIIEIDYSCIVHAIDISINNQLSYWDSLIIAAAQKAGCSILYTEDLNAGQKFDRLIVSNPF